MCVVFGLPILFAVIIFCCKVAINSNGLDQLHDCIPQQRVPHHNVIIIIHWYVWTNQVGLFLLRLLSALFFSAFIKYTAYASNPVLALIGLILLGITLCLER